MAPIVFRAVSTLVSVVIAVAVSLSIGDTNVGKIVAAAVIAGVIALMEWLMIWAPTRFAWVRRQLDPRSVMAGVWVQRVKNVYPRQEALTNTNRLAIYAVEYRRHEGYVVQGTAYSDKGAEVARWWSVGTATFSKDGQSMTYMFDGTVTDDRLPQRTGIGWIHLSSPDAGTGRVEHVSLNRSIDYNCRRATSDWLRERGVVLDDPDQLRDPEVRDRVAPQLAAALAGPNS